MADFYSSLWSWAILVIALISVIGCGIFLFIQDSSNFNPGKTTGHVWDETLQEYDNPLPRWLKLLFYITVFFALSYLFLYPGLGSMPGKLNWTQVSQYQAQMKEADQKYGALYDKYVAIDIPTLAKDESARDLGKRLYLTYCATCHGSDAKGAIGFPNLTDHIWLWGGTPGEIKKTIQQGRVSVMTPKGVKPDMTAAQVAEVVEYTRSLANLTHDQFKAQKGEKVFQQACVACHGIDGKGNTSLGYPNLTIADPQGRLYGTSRSRMMETVTLGRKNKMPAFSEFLGEAKVHVLAAYIWGLGGGEDPVLENESSSLEKYRKIFSSHSILYK